jgi:putative addiction module component (TIGR02574 family)
MTPKALRQEILQLPPAERLELVEEIWDSLAATPAAVPVPDWHRAELDRRLEQPAGAPDLSPEEVRARLGRQG